MTKLIEWKCDGCGEMHKRAPGETPAGYTIVQITLDGYDARHTHRNGTRAFDLCEQCQRLLFERANPTMWPKSKVEDVAA